MRDHKIVFNLSIKDLKDLGIIKKRKKKKKRLSKYYKNIIPSNIKSSSDHMVGSYSNLFNNTSNLQTENLMIQNKNLLENSETSKQNNKKLLEIENNIDELYGTGDKILTFLDNKIDDRFTSKPKYKPKGLSNINTAYINRIGYNIDDGDGASIIAGSDQFESQAPKDERIAKVPPVTSSLPSVPTTPIREAQPVAQSPIVTLPEVYEEEDIGFGELNPEHETEREHTVSAKQSKEVSISSENKTTLTDAQKKKLKAVAYKKYENSVIEMKNKLVNEYGVSFSEIKNIKTKGPLQNMLDKFDSEAKYKETLKEALKKGSKKT